jgi:GT2 family glycosyltransferase
MPHNKGFARACNQAIRAALAETDCQYIFLLNNDASVAVDTLARLVQAAEERPSAGILGPMIYYRRPAKKIWYAGARRRRVVLAARVAGRGQIDRGQFGAIAPVDYVFGAAMFVRRQVFEQAGLFDERYFLYLEDLDLCLRAQQAGFNLLFVPHAHIWHAVSASTAGNLPVRRYHQIYSTLLFLRKHLSPWEIIPAALFWSAIFLHSLWFDVLSDGFMALRAYRRALSRGFHDQNLPPQAIVSSPDSSTRMSPPGDRAGLHRTR